MPTTVRRQRNRRVRRVARRKAGKRVAKRSGTTQYAKIRESYAFTDINPGLNYNFDFNLSQFIRASQLAPNFKWYKATKVTWTIEPLYNTFQDGTAGTEVTMPYYYMVMNRTQDNSQLNLLDFQAMGCKPKKMTSKQVISYRPNWCSGGLNMQWYNTATGAYEATPQLGLQAQYGWLASPNKQITATNNGTLLTPLDPLIVPPFGISTNLANIYTNATVYNGHSVFIDQGVPTGTLQPVGKIVCTVDWVFKDPQCSYLQSGQRDPLAKGEFTHPPVAV